MVLEFNSNNTLYKERNEHLRIKYLLHKEFMRWLAMWRRGSTTTGYNRLQESSEHMLFFFRDKGEEMR